MSYLDRIRECNSYDPGNFRPFRVAGETVGWIKVGVADALASYDGVISVREADVALSGSLGDYAARTSAFDEVLRDMAVRGLVPGWRDEPYPVGGPFGGPHLMEMERAAVPLFGVRAYGIHVNGYVRDGAEIRMWVARRSRTKPTYPGMLDNMIAGGQPVGLGLMENVIKEAAEEAGVPESLAAGARVAGAIGYCQETETGLKPDIMFVFDLELPADFVPENTDGEIESFDLVPASRVLQTVATGGEFKDNCNLVIIDFGIRHGLIAPDGPDYLEILEGLRGWNQPSKPAMLRTSSGV